MQSIHSSNYISYLKYVIVNFVPSPSFDCTEIWPFSDSMMALAKESPMPTLLLDEFLVL